MAHDERKMSSAVNQAFDISFFAPFPEHRTACSTENPAILSFFAQSVS
jgi:hypothetical protein